MYRLEDIDEKMWTYMVTVIKLLTMLYQGIGNCNGQHRFIIQMIWLIIWNWDPQSDYIIKFTNH